MRIFGDDGFRDKVGVNLLSENFLNNFFDKINFLIKIKKIKKIIVGYDTRASRKYLLNKIIKNIKSVNTISYIKHPISTPGLQYLSKYQKCFGIMITASHFPANFNGFKFFINGNKLSKKDETFIEKKVLIGDKFFQKKKIKVKIKKINSEVYINFLNKIYNFNFKEQIIIDCANGSLSPYIKKLKFLKKNETINVSSSENKINYKCGTNFLKTNYKKPPYNRFNYCLAFDGDADRFLISKKKYGVIETEKIALIFALFFAKEKKINNIISTEIANPWLKEELKKIKIKNINSKVGDRNVIQKIKQNNSYFGFETSGHFSFNNSMDGILSSIYFTKILSKDKNLVNQVLKKKINFNKKIYAIPLKNYKIIKKYLKNKKKKIKIVLRKSIWNNYAKLYIFYKNEDLIEMKKIQKYLNNKFLKIKIKN